MIYRVLQYGSDGDLKVAIRQLMPLGCQGLIQSEEWFQWRYTQNPSGKAIIVGAFENERMVACMVVELFCLVRSDNQYLCGCVSVVAIMDGFEKKKILLDLTTVAEKEAKIRGLDLLFAFDNEYNQLREADVEWDFNTVEMHHEVLTLKPIRSIFRLSDIRKAFVPNRCVAYHPVGVETLRFDELAKGSDDYVGRLITPDMLRWLITFTDKEYVVIDNNDVTVIAIVGRRGKQKDVNLLTSYSKMDGVNPKMCQKGILESIGKMNTPDEVSSVVGEQLLAGGGLLKSSSKLYYAYKVLKDGVEREGELATAIHRWL